MFQLLFFMLFYLNITLSCTDTHYDDEEIKHLKTHTTMTKLANSMGSQQGFLIFINTYEMGRRADIYFINPETLKKLGIFLNSNSSFTTPLRAIADPYAYESMMERRPSFPSVNNQILQQKFDELFESSNKAALKNINALANELLPTLNYPKQTFITFNSIYLYDREILRTTLRSFFGIINRPEKINHSKQQIFMSAFSQIWKNLYQSNNNSELNITLHLKIGKIVGFGPSYHEEFQQTYPALTKWLNENFVDMRKDLMITYFTLSLMHALAPKTYEPIQMQVIVPASVNLPLNKKPASLQNSSLTSARVAPNPKRNSRILARTLYALSASSSQPSNSRFGSYFEEFEELQASNN